MGRLVLCFAAVACAICGVAVGSGLPPEAFNTLWTYNETFAAEKGLKGPSGWGDSWPYCKTAGEDTVQSPINIETAKVSVGRSGVLPLVFTRATTDITGQNTGASLSFSPRVHANFTTYSGRKYVLNEAHIHWDRYDNHRGSEHLVDGVAEAAEVHLVHYDAAFKSQDEAVHDGSVGNIAVVGIRYVVAESADEESEVPLFSIFSDLQFALDSMKTVKNIDLYDLFGSDASLESIPMFHYNGSLTTPTCNPIVSWFVVQRPVKVSQEQMVKLRECLHVNVSAFEEGVIVDNNARPACPLNGRQVVAWPVVDSSSSNYDSSHSSSSSSSTSPSSSPKQSSTSSKEAASTVVVSTALAMILGAAMLLFFGM